MKIITLLFLTFFISIPANQTNCLELQYRAVQRFKDLSQHKFIKSFSFGLACGNGTTRKTMKCVFSKKTNYHFISVTNDTKDRNQLKIEIYDQQKHLIASNVSTDGTILKDDFNVTITKAGIYDLICTWKKKSLCGVVAYGFIKDVGSTTILRNASIWVDTNLKICKV